MQPFFTIRTAQYFCTSAVCTSPKPVQIQRSHTLPSGVDVPKILHPIILTPSPSGEERGEGGEGGEEEEGGEGEGGKEERKKEEAEEEEVDALASTWSYSQFKHKDKKKTGAVKSKKSLLGKVLHTSKKVTKHHRKKSKSPSSSACEEEDVDNSSTSKEAAHVAMGHPQETGAHEQPLSNSTPRKEEHAATTAANLTSPKKKALSENSTTSASAASSTAVTKEQPSAQRPTTDRGRNLCPGGGGEGEGGRGGRDGGGGEGGEQGGGAEATPGEHPLKGGRGLVHPQPDNALHFGTVAVHLQSRRERSGLHFSHREHQISRKGT